MADKNIIGIIAGIITILGITFTILSRYVSADTFVAYKEGVDKTFAERLIMITQMSERETRIEAKVDMLLLRSSKGDNNK